MTDNLNKTSEGQEQQNKELTAKMYPKEYYEQLLKPGAIFTMKGTASFLKCFENDYSQGNIKIFNVPEELDMFREDISSKFGRSDHVPKSTYTGKDIALFKIKEIFPCGEYQFVITTESGKSILLNMKHILEPKKGMFTKMSTGYEQILESNLSNKVKVQDKGKIITITNGAKEVAIP